MAEVTELITRFSFQGSEQPLNKYNNSLSSGIVLLGSLAATAAVTAGVFARWASSILSAEQPLINLSSETGIAVEAIQELGFVASVSNSSTEALASSLSGLSTKIGEAAQKGSEEFARLGISVRDSNGQVKNADTILMEVGERFKSLNLSMSEQKSFSEALGIDSSLLTLMSKSSTEIRALRNEAREMGVLTKNQTDQAMLYNDALTKMNFAMDGVRRLVAIGLAPEMTSLAGTFTNLLKNNKEWIVSGITATVSGINNILDASLRLAPFLGVIAAAFFAAKIATLGFSGALAAVISPAILIAAGIASALFVLDDLIVAFQGGKSVVRDFFMTFFDFDINPVLIDIVEGFKGAFNTVADLAKSLMTGFVGIFSGIGKIFSGEFMEAFKLIDESIKGLIPDWIKNLINTNGSFSIPISDNSLQPGRSQAFTNSTNTRTEVNVQQNIRTNDPDRAGRTAAESLQRQIESAQTLSNRGGM